MRRISIAVVTALALGATVSAASSVRAGDEAVTLVFQHQFSDAESTEIERLVGDFESSHPNITIELVRDNDSSYYDKLVTQITAGEGPDIVRLEPPKVAQYTTAGWLAPLDEVIPDDERADYFANTLDAASRDGVLYAVPQDVSTLALFYRTDLFEEGGIAGPPATWDELVTTAAALTDDGTYGIGLFGGWGAYEFYPWLWQAGGDVLNEDGTEAVFNSDAGVRALQLWVDLQESSMPPGMAAATEDDVRGPFVNGTLAMFTSGPYMMATLEGEDIGDVWAVAPLPAGETSASVLGGMDLAVLENSDHQAEAKEFLSWLLQDDVQTEWATNLGFVPVKLSLYESEAFADNEAVAAFGEIIETSRSRPTIEQAGEVDAALGEAVQAALSGAADPQSALDAAAETANDAIGG